MKRGEQAFWDYYQNWFDREQLAGCLRCNNLPVLRFSAKNTIKLKKLWEEAGLTWKVLPWYPLALEWPEAKAYGEILPGYEERLFYPMNRASLLPALALELSSNDVVLDACAAPGGKALMIADLVMDEGHLVANDLSSARVANMRAIFTEYGFNQIETICMPAETIYKDAYEVFDKILLDAPCSSEKHVVENPQGLSRWSTKRVKQLRQRQYVLILQLLKALKPGGRLVYSTCAITPEENEAVVARVLKNRGNEVELTEFDWSAYPGGAGIKGDYVAEFDLNKVRRIKPDCHGLDPMFVAIFSKKS